MDVSSPALWMCIDISSSVKDEFQITELHQSELTVQVPKQCHVLGRFVPACSCVPSVVHCPCPYCFTDRALSIMGENAVI